MEWTAPARPVSCLETRSLKSHFSVALETEPDQGIESVSWEDLKGEVMKAGRAKVVAQKDELELKLRFWGEHELADKLQECCKPILLGCVSCGERSDGFKSCKRRWCPVCSRRKSAERVERFRQVTATFQWPMHVTLTRVNDYELTPDRIRAFTRAFAKLRRRKVWKNCTAGGISSLEVTNKGHGWHVHGHALIDCEWLGNKVKPPQRGSSKDHKKVIYQAAAAEFAAVWAKILGQEVASIKIRRCDVSEAIKEVLKYAIKPGDLIDFPDNPAILIRAIESCRMMSTFGSAWGFKFAKPEREKTACPCCGLDSPCIPFDVLERIDPLAARNLESTREEREKANRRKESRRINDEWKAQRAAARIAATEITPTSPVRFARPRIAKR